MRSMPHERAENPRLAQTALRSGSLAGVESESAKLENAIQNRGLKNEHVYKYAKVLNTRKELEKELEHEKKNSKARRNTSGVLESVFKAEHKRFFGNIDHFDIV